MFKPGTILTLKNPQSTEDYTFPYDRVKVIGTSPVSHAGGAMGNWSGQEAQGIVVAPDPHFGATLDEPYGKLLELYEVESIPEPTDLDRAARVTEIEVGPSPEEYFKAQDRNKKESDHREPTAFAEKPKKGPGRPRKDAA